MGSLNNSAGRPAQSSRRRRARHADAASTSKSSRRVFSIRLIVTCVALGITIISVLSVGSVQERNARAALTAELQNRILLEARSLALTSSSALLTDFPELVLHPLIKEMRDREPELGHVMVLDHEGMIQGDADSRMLGTKFTLPADYRTVATNLNLDPGERLVGNDKMLVALAEVRPPGGKAIGTTAVGLERRYIDQIIGAARAQQLVILGVVLAIGIFGTLIIMTLLLRPVAVLRSGLERIGRGDLDTPLALNDRTEFGMLADTVNNMASELKTAQAEMVEKERMTHELELARQIQKSLLPASRMVSGSFLIDGIHQAASEVGGDYYDVSKMSDGRIALTVADVAGKGLGGCLVTSMLSALLSAFREQYDSPTELLSQLDKRLGQRLRVGSFVTMFYGVLDPRSGILRFASAGHLPTLIYRGSSARIEQYTTKGIPLCAIRGGVIRRTLTDVEVQLGPGDMLLQYTDGVNEAFDASGERQFDFERLSQTFRNIAPKGGKATLHGIGETVERWRGGSARHDDETLLIVSREICVPVERDRSEPKSRIERQSDDQAARCLAEARRRGERIQIAADMDQLEQVKHWLSSKMEQRMHGTNRTQLIATAVYEACANIIEHGYGKDRSRSFELWWVPRIPSENASRDSARSTDATAPLVPTNDFRGFFLIRDEGRPFSGENWIATDFNNPESRRRSRGFGLDIIHRVMDRVAYSPSTTEGNITLLEVETLEVNDQERDLRHA